MERLDERSYEVEAMDGSSYGWNRAHLKQTNELPSELPESPPNRTVFFGGGATQITLTISTMGTGQDSIS